MAVTVTLFCCVFIICVCLFSQHLTTFVLDRKDGMMTVEDGVRRLRLLDAKGKVWTQEMLLQVEEKSVSLLDQDTQVTFALKDTRLHTHVETIVVTS